MPNNIYMKPQDQFNQLKIEELIEWDGMFWSLNNVIKIDLRYIKCIVNRGKSVNHKFESLTDRFGSNGRLVYKGFMFAPSSMVKAELYWSSDAEFISAIKKGCWWWIIHCDNYALLKQKKDELFETSSFFKINCPTLSSFEDM